MCCATRSVTELVMHPKAPAPPPTAQSHANPVQSGSHVSSLFDRPGGGDGGVREWDFVYLIIRSENIEPRRHDTKISGFRFDLQQRLEQKKSSIA